MLRIVLLCVCACNFISPSNAQVPFLGSCPDIAVVTDFQPAKYLGKWYEAERYFAIFQFGGKCVSATYSSKDDGSIKVFNRQLSSLSGTFTTIVGEAKLADKADEAKLIVRFPSMPIDFPAPYWVVDTDYDSYAVVWGCNDFGLFHTRNAWILTREQNPSIETLQKAYASLDKNKINKSLFQRTDQNTCPDEDAKKRKERVKSNTV